MSFHLSAQRLFEIESLQIELVELQQKISYLTNQNAPISILIPLYKDLHNLHRRIISVRKN